MAEQEQAVPEDPKFPNTIFCKREQDGDLSYLQLAETAEDAAEFGEPTAVATYSLVGVEMLVASRVVTKAESPVVE